MVAAADRADFPNPIPGQCKRTKIQQRLAEVAVLDLDYRAG